MIVNFNMLIMYLFNYYLHFLKYLKLLIIFNLFFLIIKLSFLPIYFKLIIFT